MCDPAPAVGGFEYPTLEWQLLDRGRWAGGRWAEGRCAIEEYAQKCKIVSCLMSYCCLLWVLMYSFNILAAAARNIIVRPLELLGWVS